MDSQLSTVVPVALAVSVVSIFSLAAYFSGDSSDQSEIVPTKKRLRSSSLTGASANNNHLTGESQNYLPSATRTGLQALQLGSDLSENGFALTNSSNRRRQSYSNINSRYPMTARLGHVVEALDDLRQLQRDTESALEEQCRQTEAERQLRSRMEESLQAESQLRRDAEASVQIYREQLELMRAQVRDQHSSSSDHHSRARSIIDMLATLIADKSSLESNLEMANQLLAQLSAEVTRS